MSGARLDADLRPGSMAGEYQLEHELGRGGMGQVYAAIHPVIRKRAAIKVLLPELSVNAEAVDRFVQEARAVNEIGHPNIIDIFSFGTLSDGRCYFVMELLRGESVRQRLARGRVPRGEAFAIVEAIADALAAAHAKGIVHRDLKPDNVFLVESTTGPPRIKLLDFGVAKLVGVESMQHTQTGVLLGTPAYASPEQARARGVDHRTDIYALGAVLFELLTGELVFVATNAADMIAKHLLEPPRSARSLDPSISHGLDALISRMLAKEIVDRPSLAEVCGVLRAESTLRAEAPPAPASSRRARSAIVLVSAVITFVVGLIAIAVTPSSSSSPDAAPVVAPVVVDATPVVIDAATAVDARLAIDAASGAAPIDAPSKPTKSRLPAEAATPTKSRTPKKPDQPRRGPLAPNDVDAPM